MPLNGQSVRFGKFELALKSAELRCNGAKIKLQDQPFQVLVALLEHPGEVVSREELRHRLWPNDVFVDYERSLNAAVKRLREALGDEADTPHFIETLPRHGYRFIGNLESQPDQRPVRRPRIRWIVATLLSISLLAVAVFLIRALWKRSSSPVIRSIAVLPLQNLNHDPSQDYFADGVTEALISELSRMEPLTVISFTSSMQFKNTSKPLPKIAEELNVNGLVEGSVLREGDRVRIRTRLIDARSDRTVWSETYDRDMRDILGLQAEVAQAIARQIQISLSAQERARATGTRKIDPEVQENYLKGRYFLNRGATKESIQAFESAIQKDSNYALAYAGLAESLALATPPQVSRAKEMALRALSIDDSVADAHTALGTIYFLSEWNWAGAETEFQRALQLDPSSAEAHSQYAYYLAATGRMNEAVAEARQAQRLDPLALRMTINYGRVLYYSRKYEDAIAQFTQVLALDPRLPLAYMMRGFTKQKMGRFDEAFADFRQAWTLTKNTKAIEILDSKASELDKIRSIAKLFEAAVPSGKAQITSVAMQYAQTGDIDKAFEYLERGFQTRSRSLVFLKVDPVFDNLRGDPRFQEMLQRLNFPPS